MPNTSPASAMRKIMVLPSLEVVETFMEYPLGVSVALLRLIKVVPSARTSLFPPLGMPSSSQLCFHHSLIFTAKDQPVQTAKPRRLLEIVV
jgi:hypothetical protein